MGSNGDILNQLILFIGSSINGKQKMKDIMAIITITYCSTVVRRIIYINKLS